MNTKLVVPPMPDGWLPENDLNGLIFSVDPICDWGSLGWQTAQREAALADELAVALESLESLFDKMEKGFDYPAEVRFAARDAAKAAIQSHKEARNG